jgi:hypothetical protein
MDPAAEIALLVIFVFLGVAVLFTLGLKVVNAWVRRKFPIC